MRRSRRSSLVTLALILVAAFATPAQSADPVHRTFNASADRMWTVTEAVLKNLGWDIDRDKTDRTIGVISTESRVLSGENYGVYANETRHRLRMQVKPAGETRSTVTIERTVFKRERKVFVNQDEPIATTDTTVETKLLDEIGRAL